MLKGFSQYKQTKEAVKYQTDSKHEARDFGGVPSAVDVRICPEFGTRLSALLNSSNFLK